MQLTAFQLEALRDASTNSTGRLELLEAKDVRCLLKAGYAIQLDADGRAVFTIEKRGVVFGWVRVDHVQLEKPCFPIHIFITAAGRDVAKSGGGK